MPLIKNTWSFRCQIL